MEWHLSFFLVFCFSFVFSFACDTITPTQSISDGQTIVSSFQSFELGFFSPGKSQNRYLGIWFKSSPESVVWVANRNNPIIDSTGVLSISEDGNLVLLNQIQSIIWSSNISGVAEDPVAQLLDTGNLVLRNNIIVNSGSYLWQSFDYPSDTMLAGMKLGWNLTTGQQLYLTSWKSTDDPSPGSFTYNLDILGLPQLVIYKGSMKWSRTGPLNGIYVGATPNVANMVFNPIMVFNPDEMYYMYRPVSDNIVTLLKLNQSGSLERLIWNNNTAEWKVLYSMPYDTCDIYGRCGGNAICSVSKSTIYNCLTGVRVPDLLEYSLNENLSLQECKAECSKNCSCTAYANSNASKSSGCLMWFDDLVDIRLVAEVYSGEAIYIRMPPSNTGKSEEEKCPRVYCFRIKTKDRYSGFDHSGTVFVELVQESTNKDIEIPLFDLATIAAATDNFSLANLIGEGGFGPVYKGNLSTGEEVAVKRLSKNSGQGREQFMNEIDLLAKLRHRNLVEILGSLSCSGYMSPEYAFEGTISVKSDVFSLGVLMLEIVSGKKNKGFHHTDHHHNLLGHAWVLWNEGKALELMDECLRDSCVTWQVQRCIQVGLLCVQNFPEDRPAMSSVVFMFANEAAILPQPKQPGFFTSQNTSHENMNGTPVEESHTENDLTITSLDGR
ncbi:hypothetical protein GH714_008915 [Hevea brasiliensis]|uniref:Receptor-like serine/threonine-protein kinase n=1 Tax=Hevea brasiliensis TaxID=3981 RepID=A0A6A6KCR8_HEVBR|nr:hypothetical protein GH714_008915 [Hevea brasiliensis]